MALAFDNRVVLVQCGSRKLDHAAPAAQLYTGSLFVSARRYAQSTGRPWYILSAKHTLIDPRDTFAPYDLRVNKLSPADQKLWAQQCFSRMQCVRPQRCHVEVLASEAYTRHLAPLLTRAGYDVSEPLAGMPMGFRMQWLKEHTHAR